MDPDELAAMRSAYTALYDPDPVAPAALAEIERRLGVVLPGDLRAVASFSGGGFLGGLDHLALAPGGPADNIVDETLRLQDRIGLPHLLVLLAEPSGSLVVMWTQDRPDRPAPVWWLSATDAARLATGERFLSCADRYDSYASFFRELLGRAVEEGG